MGEKSSDVGESYLRKKLRREGLRAFNELCRLGCDRGELGTLFAWLSEHKEVRLDSGVTIPLQALDRRKTAHAGVRLSEFPKIAKRAKKLMVDVKRLRKTELIGHLMDQGVIRRGDLLFGSHLFDGSAPFDGLLLLPKIAKQCGPKQRPDYTRMRKEIHRYIRGKTGIWHDTLFADVHNSLFRHSSEQIDEKGVAAWRRRHHLTADSTESAFFRRFRVV
jgi:hypothetical protein